MSGYPLQSVLDLRQRQEDEAVQHLADATLQLARARATEKEWEVRVTNARQRLAQASPMPQSRGADPGDATNLTASDLLGQAQFIERLRSELHHVRAGLDQFRRGVLAQAKAAENAAREVHLAARRAREAFSKHAEKHQAAARIVVARQQEEALDDIARAAGHARATRRGS